MSTKHQENQRRPAELNGSPSQNHGVAVLHGDEHAHHVVEHTDTNHEETRHATPGHGVTAFGHAEIAQLAYERWESRGCPEGTAEQDWLEAAHELRARARTV